jgi:SAM-dependent methyltransferase
MARDRWERLQRSYDVVAADYEAAFLDELAHKPRDRELLTRFAAQVGDPVVDLGCGPGQIGAFVRSQGREVVGLDLSVAMAVAAGRRLGRAVQADVRQLPVRPGSLGGILAFYSLIHVRRGELRPVLATLGGALRPGGRLLVSAHEGDGELTARRFLGRRVPFVATLFRLEELTDAAGAAGLHVGLAERRAPYPDEHPTHRLYVEAIRP